MRETIRQLVPSRERNKAIAFVAVWVVTLGLVWSATALVTSPPEPAGPVHAILVVEAPTWGVIYEAVTENGTAFGLLREANLTIGFPLAWVDYGWPYDDVFVTSINGRENGVDGRWWQYCVNGGYATQGARHQSLRNDDVVTWVFAPQGGEDLCN